MFQGRKVHVLKGDTNKAKNMAPIGSILFPLKVAPMRIENDFKGHLIEELPKIIYTNKSDI